MRTVAPIDLSSVERWALTTMARDAERRLRQRALIVLYAADGIPNRKIATLVGLNQNQVSMWRKRYEVLGLVGLKDLPRSGRPRRLNDGRACAESITGQHDYDEAPSGEWTCRYCFAPAHSDGGDRAFE